MSKRLFGLDLLADQAAEHAREIVLDSALEIEGDSEIEKLLHLAICMRVWVGLCEHVGVGHLENDQEPPIGREQALSLYIKRQVQFEFGRVDFVVYAYDHTMRILRAPGWRQLIIECDGHDFHERTKEQAKRDRSRDRMALLGGRDVMRFTGSEIWNDPWGCAGEVIDWASRSFG